MFEKPECHSEFHKLVMGIDLALLDVFRRLTRAETLGRQQSLKTV
jgi:hypothetical protein